MSVQIGTVFPYTEYREHFRANPPQAVIWKWADLAGLLDASRHTERGTLTLATADSASGCELLPGAAISMQVVKPSAATRPHSHSWWHLFVVQAGTGTMRLGDAETQTSLNRGDVVVVPAWCAHSIENLSAQNDLILMSLTNLPQQAGLLNLLAKEPDDQVEPLPMQAN